MDDSRGQIVMLDLDSTVPWCVGAFVLCGRIASHEPADQSGRVALPRHRDIRAARQHSPTMRGNGFLDPIHIKFFEMAALYEPAARCGADWQSAIQPIPNRRYGVGSVHGSNPLPFSEVGPIHEPACLKGRRFRRPNERFSNNPTILPCELIG